MSQRRGGITDGERLPEIELLQLGVPEENVTAMYDAAIAYRDYEGQA